MSDLLFGHVFVHDLLDNNQSKVVKTVSRSSEVLVDADRTFLLRIVPMLVDPTMGFLFFQLADILLRMTSVTERQVYGVF